MTPEYKTLIEQTKILSNTIKTTEDTIEQLWSGTLKKAQTMDEKELEELVNNTSFHQPVHLYLREIWRVRFG